VNGGACFATKISVLHLDDARPDTPRLPKPTGALGRTCASALVHAALVVAIVTAATSGVPPAPSAETQTVARQQPIDVRHFVFIAKDVHPAGGGGGGGGNQQAGPIRRAVGVGSDAITLPVRKPPSPAPVATPSTAAVPELSPLPSLVLDAKPLASGTYEQIGLPSGGVSSGTSTGPGSGGGVGTGVGTGIGSGEGPGIGPGSGGGMGGGVYRPGGSVTVPRVITEVKPTYTNDALKNKVQGSVVLELVVTRDGRPSQIRVIRSLDPGGLDGQAIAAAAQWRFEPGRLAGTPVDVLVTIVLDFRIF
jgi:TonB family protein